MLEPPSFDGTLIGAIVGGIGGVLLVIAAVALCIVAARRRRLPNEPNSVPDNRANEPEFHSAIYSSVRPIDDLYDDVDRVRATD
jgi:hypothetical protein